MPVVPHALREHAMLEEARVFIGGSLESKDHMGFHSLEPFFSLRY